MFGHEAFTLDLGATAVTVGLGCGPRAVTPTLRSGAPRLGAITRVQGDELPGAGAAALMFAARAAQPSLLSSRCALYGNLATGAVVVPLPLANGRFDVALSVPALPQLVSVKLSVQAAVGSTAGLELTNGLDWSLGW